MDRIIIAVAIGYSLLLVGCSNPEKEKVALETCRAYYSIAFGNGAYVSDVFGDFLCYTENGTMIRRFDSGFIEAKMRQKRLEEIE